MSRFIAPVAWFLLGAALVAYGVTHAVVQYPGVDTFRRFLTTIPELMAITLFALGIVAAIGGIALMVNGSRGVRERWTQIERAYGAPKHPRRGPTPDDEEDWYAYH